MSDDEDKKDKKNFLSLVPIDGEKGDGDHGLGESRPVLPDEIATLENGQGAGSKRRDRKREKANRALEILEEHKAELLQKIPLGRFGDPEEVAAAVSFLASYDAAYFSGSTLNVNGCMYMI